MSDTDAKVLLELELDPSISRHIGRSIVITGAARSGTTMMGQLIHSLRRVEYGFEPPLLFSLLPLITDLDRATWCLLFETYLFEDLLMEAVAGRRLNYNRNDDSSVFVAKSEAEVKRRLESSVRRPEAERAAKSSTLAFKSPDVTPFLARLREYYPDLEVVVMLRRPDAVVSSVERKGWFTDESLNGTSRIWPSRSGDGPSIPFWVPKDERDRWRSLSEVERGYFYYLTIYDPILHMPGTHIVDYDRFIEDPSKHFERLAEALALSPGTKTQSLIDGVYRPERRVPDLRDIDSHWRERAEKLHSQCRAAAEA